MTRYWALRTDQQRRAFFWRELQAGRLRQGWGTTPDLNLENLAAIRQRGGRLEGMQAEAWRGNRRLLPSEPDGMQVGDIVVFLHLPEYGRWSIARITGGYRYQISSEPNAVDGTPDYGHIRDVELVTGPSGIDPANVEASGELRRSMRPMLRMWSLDAHGEEVERLLASARTL